MSQQSIRYNMDKEIQDIFNNLKKDDEKTEQFNLLDALKEEKEEVTKETVEPSQEGENNTPVQEDIPFHKNPKVTRYIQKQVEKALADKKPVERQEAVHTDPDVPAQYQVLYGEQAKQVWDLQKPIFEHYFQRAKQEAVNEVRSDFQKQIEAEKQYENFIADSLEGIEDEYSIDLTSNAPAAKKARSEFLELVETLSPKDEYGNVKEYADFNATWKLYSTTRKKESDTVSRQKQLSSRSMTKSSETKAIDPKSPKTPISFDSIS